jgi:elongation factor G
MEGVRTGDTLGASDRLGFPVPPAPVFSLAITLEDRKDEVRLSGALQRLLEEDTSLTLHQDAEMGQMVLAGQGDIHLRAAIERLSAASGVKVKSVRPQVAYRETIRRPVRQHARLKRQTGGHGQFADVTLEIEPRPRGEGFSFTDRIVGGVVPKRFIPAVGEAAEEATRKGPLGHKVVDVAVTLVDGTFHSVDSSDMAFATATRIAMQEGLAKADPVLLEPIDHVAISVPSDYTPAAQRLLSGHRGQILGFAAKAGWEGWDEVEALVPEAELHELIIELRSQTMGLGTYARRFDHLAESRAAR